jgi:formiminoglutamase
LLQNWLKPISKPIVAAIDALPEHALGRHIVPFSKELPDLKKVRIALIGTDEAESNAVRQALYAMVYPYTAGAVADLGNLRKNDPAQLIPVLFELITGGILPIVISRSHALARAQFMAYQEAKALANWVAVDETIRNEAVLDGLLKPRHPMLFHLGVIGLQVHQTAPALLKIFEKNNFDALRLGKSRTVIEETEPILRDADLLTFHANALKMSELPAVEGASPSGYFLEEACQLCRYAGMSDKLTSFGVYGLCADRDRDHQSAQAVAQLIWYFMDGVFNRQGDFPVSIKGLTEYVVDIPAYNYQLTFWKSTYSGRWWLQVPADIKRKQQRHRLIPCSYQDYQAACREELPERLFNAFKRF